MMESDHHNEHAQIPSVEQHKLEAGAIEYRPLVESDYDALASLWWKSWRSTGLTVAQGATEKALRRRIDDEIQSGWDVTLALLNGQLAGLLALKLRSATLDQLFIAPDLQGRGIGQKLLHVAKQKMPAGFSLRTAVENVSACRFYEKVGLTRAGVTIHPVLGRALVTYCWCN